MKALKINEYQCVDCKKKFYAVLIENGYHFVNRKKIVVLGAINDLIFKAPDFICKAKCEHCSSENTRLMSSERVGG